MLQDIDPVELLLNAGILLEQSLRQEDDGSALFLLNAAARLLQILEEAHSGSGARNALEIACDGMGEPRSRAVETG